jgi:myo-inositol-1(or 4)-monophosphatase
MLDRGAEARIVERLRTCRPGDAIVGEEGANEAGSTGIQWLIDPIDGTTNFVYDLGGYAISIGALDAHGALAGAVYIPSTGELFSAHRGGGATCDGATISPSVTRELGQALVGTGFSYDADRRRVQAQRMALLLPQVRDLRRFGAAAVDLCLVACGRLDVYFEQHLNPWDTAAGALIAAEAGCRLGDFLGGPARHDEVLVSAPALFEPMVALLDATSPPVA